MRTIKKIATAVICSLVCQLLVFSVPASAHEIFYYGYGPGYSSVNLKWDNSISSVARLKINGDYLDGLYSAHYTAARNAWNSSANVSATQSTFSQSDVDMATATVSAWEEMFGYFGSINTLGICQMSSTDGYSLDSSENALASSKRIKYASILLTPHNNYDNTTHIRKTMVHEIGHALGLGHPNTQYYVTQAASVMRQGTTETYYAPQAHDISDLRTKYN